MIILPSVALLAAPQLGAFQDFIGGVPQAGTLQIVDIDADGDDDVVVSSRVTGEVQVVRQGPAGTYGEPERLVDLDRAASTPVFHDLDLDGDPDLLAIRYGTVLVSSLNHGAAGFGEVESLFDQGLGGGFSASADLAVFDVKGDARPEVVWISDALSAQDRVFLGEGLYGGTFSSAVVGSVNARTYSLVATDLDGDGDRDLAVLDLGGIQVIRNDGGGAFAPPVVAVDLGFANTGGGQLVAADVDGDLDQDLLLAIPNRRFEVLPGDGALGFGPPRPILSTTPSVLDVELVDLDQDGDPDLVFSLPFEGRRIVTMRNTGAGQFDSAAPTTSEASFVRQLEVADLDGDGTIEVIHSADPGRVRVRDIELVPSGLRASETFEEVISSPGSVDLFEVADLDLDGNQDLFTLLRLEGQILWWPGHTTGGYGTPRRIPTTPAGNPYRSVECLDLEGDGDLDIVLAGSSATPDRWIEGLAPGVFGLTREIAPTASEGGGIFPADLDGDGVVDLVRANRGGDLVEWIRFVPGLGFGAPVTVATLPAPLFAELVLDVDGDGDLDLVFDLRRSGPTVNDLGWIENVGGASFGPFASLDASPAGGLGPAHVVAADIDGDGLDDLVRVLSVGGFSSASSEVFVLGGLGGGAFAAPRSVAALAGSSLLAPPRFADVDLDGDLDLVTGVLQSELTDFVARLAVAVHRGRGDGTFEAPDPAAVQIPGGQLAAPFDADGDGDVDALGFSAVEQRLGWYENLISGSVGLAYCGPALANASGARARIEARGSASVGASDLTLGASGLPAGVFAAFLAARAESITFPVANSEGRLCLATPFGAFRGPGQVQRAGPGGIASIDVDLTALPAGAGGTTPALAGETWRFQAWFRDERASSATSNFSDAVGVTFF